MAIVHTVGRRPTPTRNSPATSGCCWRRWTRRRAEARLRDREQDRRVQPHPRHAAAGRPGQRSRRCGARASTPRTTLDTLRNVADWFGSVRGRRKAILFVSEGIDYDIHDVIPADRVESLGASMILDATREAIAAATRSNVAIYGIDPRGLTDLGDESIEIQSFPDDTTARHRPGLAAATSSGCAGQPARRCPTRPAASRSSTERRLRRPSSASSRTTAPTTCWRTTRRIARPGRNHKIEVRVSARASPSARAAAT